MAHATDYRPDPTAVELAYDKVRHWVGEEGSRQDAEKAIACNPRLNSGLRDELRDAVLDRFDRDRDPVPGKDYLPEPPQDWLADSNWPGA